MTLSPPTIPYPPTLCIPSHNTPPPTQVQTERVQELMRLNATLMESNQLLQHRLIQAALGDDEGEAPATARSMSLHGEVCMVCVRRWWCGGGDVIC